MVDQDLEVLRCSPVAQVRNDGDEAVGRSDLRPARVESGAAGGAGGDIEEDQRRPRVPCTRADGYTSMRSGSAPDAP